MSSGQISACSRRASCPMARRGCEVSVDPGERAGVHWTSPFSRDPGDLKLASKCRGGSQSRRSGAPGPTQLRYDPIGLDSPANPNGMRIRVLHHLRTGDPDMWAQLITTRLKAGREDDLPGLVEQLRALEQPGTGLVRSTAMRDQNDPSRVYMMVVFESEEKARERENDPRRQEGMQAVRATMADIFDGAPEFVDLTVVDDMSF